MKSILAAIALACGLAGCVHDGHKAAVKLTFDDGTCSGTVIGSHSILSATHCFVGAKSMAVDGKPVQVLQLISDGNDHTIAVVGATYTHIAPFGPAAKVAAHVHIYGNPANFVDLYRNGRVYGNEVVDGRTVTLWGLRIWLGDSGSGVFDNRGRLIGVISFMYTFADIGTPVTNMAGGFPLAFTPQQLAQVR